jgi:hypothetical protein
MWEPRPLTSLWAFTACYRDSFILRLSYTQKQETFSELGYFSLSGTYKSVLTDNIKGDSSRAIAQAVSRWLPTAAARVQARVWSSGICGGQSGAGAGFLRVLQFPLPIISPNSPSS